MNNFNLKKFLVENKLTTNSRILRENDEQSPNTITVKFNGNGFIDEYWKGTQGDKVSQRSGFASNLQNLKGEGHSTYGDGGLRMRKGSYYPLFKVIDKENSKRSIWYYIMYSGDEIHVIQSAEHSDQGSSISNHFDSLKGINPNWYCKFEEGITPGAIDHKGWFEIVSIP
jgi:hypothetical protein